MNQKGYAFLFVFAGILFVSAFFFNSPEEVIMGNNIILQSPANLITDYFKIANAGAALMNASFMVLKSILILKFSRVSINGSYIAAVFTVAGFSLFGKNLYNSIPIILGVFLYAKLRRYPFEKCLIPALFGTALGPLVSEFTFNLGLPLPAGVLMGVVSGLVAGMLLPLLAEHFKSFHKGFNLYNIGFTAGLIGTFFMAVLRSFGVDIPTVNLVSAAPRIPVILLLSLIFGMLFLWGVVLNGWSLRGYLSLLKRRDMESRDYVQSFNLGVALINMSLVGALATSYVLLVGGSFSGPVIGGIFTMVGFGAYGKHPLNVSPIILGVFLVGYFSMHDVSSVGILLAALFGTTLAPISQKCGPLAGIIAGGLHVALVMNVGYMHAGMNLYNNGFSGGFVAAALVPVMDAILLWQGKRTNQQ